VINRLQVTRLQLLQLQQEPHRAGMCPCKEIP
jgi:hypothetical protein